MYTYSFPSKTRPLLTMIMALSIGLMTSCAKVGPDFKAPLIEVPQQWQDSDLNTTKPIDYKEWWKQFNDATLNQLIDMAYRQNLNVQIATLRIIEARAQLGFAKGLLFPQEQELISGISYNKLSENMPNTDTHVFGSFDFGFDTLWEADIWGKFRRGIEVADANLGISTLNYEDILISLTAEVAMTYINVRTFQQRLIIAKKNIDLQNQSLNITHTLVQNDLLTNLDYKQAEYVQKNTLSTLTQLEIGLRQSQNALSILLGLNPGDLHSLLNQNQPIPTVNKEITVGIPADIIRRRPDIKREELKAAAQCALIGVAKADLFPRLLLQGSIGMASSSANGVDIIDIMNTQSLVSKVGPSISWPILQYGRLKNNIRVHDARYEQLLIAYQDSVLRALREIEDARTHYFKTTAQSILLEKSAEAAEQVAKLSLLQYRTGLKDYTPVLVAQQSLTQQQDKLAINQGEKARYLIALYKALGGGWTNHSSQPQISESTKKEMYIRTDWGELLN